MLESACGYLTLAEDLLSEDAEKFSSAYNFGPLDEDARPVEWIVARMTKAWGDGASWFIVGEPSVHEAGYLKLDASRARAELGWAPRLRLSEALDWVVVWHRAQASGADMQAFTLQQIREYEARIRQSE